MAAGYVYKIEPEPSVEERYDVESGRRRIGPYKLDTTNLPEGEYLPSFTPIAADLKKKTAQVAIRVEVAEAFTTSGSNTKLKIKKSPFVYANMYIGNGSRGAQVSSINKSNANYDELTLAADFGANLKVGDVLFEASAVGGTTPKVTANSALYERHKIGEGKLVTLLMMAFDIEPAKLAIPFHAKDKANMPYFQFNE